MSRKHLQYYLFSKNKKPLYIDDNNNDVEGTSNYLKQDGTPAHLAYDPDGWQKTQVKYARNVKYNGLFRTMTTALNFIKDGYEVIRRQMWRTGVNTVCYLGILQLDRMNVPYTYKGAYFSELNFAKYTEGETTIQIQALEGGVGKFLKAYEATEYEIPIDADEQHVRLYWTGMELGNTATFSVTNGTDFSTDADLGNHLINLDIIQKEVEDIGGAYPVPRTKVNNNNDAILQTNKSSFKATADGTITIDYDFVLSVDFVPPPAMNPAAQLNVVARLIDPVTKIVTANDQITMLQISGPANIVGTHTVKGSDTLNVKVGDELYFYTFLSPEGSTGDIQTRFVYSGGEPTIKIKYTYLHPPTEINGLLPYRVFEQLWAKMCGGLLPVKSDWLKAKRDIIFTSGMAVRQQKDAVLKISMQDFFKMLGFWCVGLGAEGDSIVIEPLGYFYRDEITADLGEVTAATLEVAEDLFFNTIKAGYNKQEYQGINGVYEFNQGQQYTTDITSVVNELDMVSPARTDPFGLELLRINFGQKTTTDNKTDNETCILNVVQQDAPLQLRLGFAANGATGFILAENNVLTLNQTIRITGSLYNDGDYKISAIQPPATGSNISYLSVDAPLIPEPIKEVTVQLPLNKRFILNRPDFSSITGLLYPATAFNVLLNPKAGLLNNGAYLHSILDLMEDSTIKFASADRNKDLIYTLNGVTVNIGADIAVKDLSPQLYKPYYFKFKTKLPVNLQQLLQLKPYGKIAFTWKGRKWYGYLFDGTVDLAEDAEQDWILLAAPKQNLLDFNKPA